MSPFDIFDDSIPCGASGGYAFGEPSLQGGIRRCASTVGIRSARARPAPRPWHAPKKLCFGGKPRAKRSARRGRKAPRSCAPNAMPPFAPPCGHFASLVRSIAPQSARVPSETLRVSAAHLASRESASSLRPQGLPDSGKAAEPGAEAACLFYGTPGMSHAKRCADKGVANEGRDPKTGNRAATGSASPFRDTVHF